MSTAETKRCPNCGADLGAVGSEVMGAWRFCGSCKRRVGEVDPRRQPPATARAAPPRRESQPL